MRGLFLAHSYHGGALAAHELVSEKSHEQVYVRLNFHHNNCVSVSKGHLDGGVFFY